MIDKRVIVYEAIAIIIAYVYVQIIGVYCDVTNLCSPFGVDTFLILKIFIYFIVIPFIAQKILCKLLQPHRDDFKTIQEFCESRGFLCQDIKIVTHDNYHIVIHRVINPNIMSNDTEPVILWHGMGASSYQWLYTSKDGAATDWKNESNSSMTDDSLAITLLNQGYDVYLPNLRGNEYANGHEYFDLNRDAKYWDFSLDEIIKYDCSAVIDKVLEVSKKSKTNYVGFSLGGMIICGLLSDRPEYNQKIRNLTIMASAVSVNSDIARYASDSTYDYFVHMLTRNSGNILPIIVSKIVAYLAGGNLYADSDSALMKLLRDPGAQYSLWYFGSRCINTSRAAVMGSHIHIAMSRKVIAHVLQFVLARRWRKFCYGKKNEDIYGSIEAPVYDVSNINVDKMTLIFSQFDRLISTEDAKNMLDELRMPNVIWDPVTVKNYDHFDLVLGHDTANVVNVKVLKSIK